jgi:uncharacterized protein YndB with AHSA1/START domain
MPEFEDRARCDAPPEDVWKLLYDPARFPDWWAGIGSVEPGQAGEYTMYPQGYPDFPMTQQLRVTESGVTISCLVSDLVFEWRLAALDGGAATSITVHVEIPEAEAHRLAAQQDVISQSLSRLAALAAAESRLATARSGNRGADGGDIAQQRQRPGGLDLIPGRGGQFPERADRGGGAAHPPGAGVQREGPPGRVGVGQQQAPAGPGHPVHLGDRIGSPARGDVMHRQGAGDDVERGVGQRQALRGADGERHSGPGVPPRVADRRLRRVDAGDAAARPGRGGQLPREVPAAAPHVQGRVSRPDPGQRDDPPVHPAPAACERDLAH